MNITNMNAWIDWEISFTKSKTMNKYIQEQISRYIEHRRNMLRMITVVKLLVKITWSSWGNNENIL